MKPDAGAVTYHLTGEKMASHLEFEQWVPFPLERVFEFFSNPENLPRIMPAASATRIINLNLIRPVDPPPGFTYKNAAGAGTTIVTSFRAIPFLPFRRRWVARITEFEWNRYFADVQEEGPFRSWHHRHEFASKTRDGVNGTLIRDVIDYEVGLKFLGTIANTLFVRRRMESTFSERQRRLPLLFN